MSRLFKGFTLNEGYTDLGTLSVDITFVESKTEPQPFVNNEPVVQTGLIFRLVNDTSPDPLSGLNVHFDIDSPVASNPLIECETSSNADGYAQFVVPQIATFATPDSAGIINFEIEGELESRDEECYIEVRDGDNNPLYTQVRQFTVKSKEGDDGWLAIYTSDEETTAYSVHPLILLSEHVQSVFISKKGEVWQFRSDTQAWSSVDTIQFTQFSNPDGLVAVDPWFYETSGTSGTITNGELGDDTFEKFSFKALNPVPVPIGIYINIPNPEGGSDLYDDTLLLTPGDKNIQILQLDYTPSAPADDTPTTGDVEAAAGITFSVPFQTFLTANDLDTVQAVRRAGPLKYMTGIPDPEAAEVATLQSYVDLYFFINSLEGCTVIRNAGYNTIYDIAITSRNVFVNDIVGGDIEKTFGVAKAHEMAVQRVSLISNVLAASMNDSRLENPVNYAGTNPKAYALFKPKCSCDDCQSGISPFAYLMDLLKYSAVHLVNDPDYTPANPVNYASFITLMKNTFYQPFGDYEVDCETLHHEYCRVRLATEVLLKLKDFTEGSISEGRLATYLTERKQYLQLTYQTLLLQMGTSFDEVRSVFLTTPDSKKAEASAKLAAKLQIPFKDPDNPSNYSTDTLWLTFTGNTDDDYDDFESSLQTVFGYRKIFEDVLVPTPESTMETWRKVYLMDVAGGQDYLLSAYSREDLNPDSPSYKADWKAIVDPDIIGLIDMRYFPEAYFHSPDSFRFVQELYNFRMEDTNNFLNYYLDPLNSLLSSTSIDMTYRKLRTIYPNNIAGDVIYDNKVRLDNGTTWDEFEIFSKIADGTNTNFTLVNSVSEPAIFQPDGATPKVRYRRKVNVDSYYQDSGNVFQVTLPTSASDLLAIASGGYVKLLSVNGLTELAYETTASFPWEISVVSVGMTPTVVSLTLSNNPDSTFLDGTLYLIYEKEVEIFIDTVPDPVLLVPNLFNTDQAYTYLFPEISLYFYYKVWDDTGWSATTYEELKSVYTDIQNNVGMPDNKTLVNDTLHLSLDQFNRMMELMILCEKYLAAMYTEPRPTSEQLYELTSYFRVSAKYSLQPTWITEETIYVPDTGTDRMNLHLTSANFWKSLVEPEVALWNPLLQTTELETPRPMIDPEFIKLSDINEGPIASDYRVDLSDRVDELAVVKNTLLSYEGADWFTKILNKVNQDNPSTPFSVSPYASLDDLLVDINSVDPFKIQEATDAAYTAFCMNKADFLRFIDIKDKYEDPDPTLTPTALEISIALDIAVTGYKRHELYATWLTEESSYKYYNIFKMRFDPVRGNHDDRALWQLTLEKWNKLPIIDPDVVPAENIVNFIDTDPAYILWNNRSDQHDDKIVEFATTFDAGALAGAQLTGLITLICNVIYAEMDDDTSLDYFLALQTLEDGGENIQPRVQQLNLTMAAYRYIRKVYDLLFATPAMDPSPLIESECDDIYDIFLQVEKEQRFFSTYKMEEYQGGIIPSETAPYILLTGDQFQIYHSPINTFPLTNLPVYNTWRSPFISRRDWQNTLESRINREKECDNAWEKILMDTEDITMQAMRNALVRVLAVDCETFDQTAERLAKSLMIETKDNCCSRHTRISQVIETIQSFIFALKNGVYDEYLEGWGIQAPNFDREWEWLGSYAAWRSAMFVYLYPENILYPTLKRYQSPAFQTLAGEMQNAARLNPEAACALVRDYENYFTDILNLDVKFSTKTLTNIFKPFSDSCCEEIYYDTEITYFFADCKTSGKSYWSSKLHQDVSGYSQGFWEELPVPSNVNLLAGYPVNRGSGRELWLFYSYREKGKLKMAYIVRDLKNRTDWTEEKEVEIPVNLTLFNSSAIASPPVAFDPKGVTSSFSVGGNSSDPDDTFGANIIITCEPFAITPAQSSLGWDWLSFIFSYKVGDGACHVHMRFKNNETLSFEIENPLPDRSFYLSENQEAPVTAVRHWNANNVYGLTIVFSTYLVSINFNLNGPTKDFVRILLDTDMPEISSMVGVYQSRNGGLSANFLYVYYKDDDNVVHGYPLSFHEMATENDLPYEWSSELPGLPPEFQQFTKISPVFSQNPDERLFFSIRKNASPSEVWLSSKLLNLAPPDSISLTDLYAITIQNVISIGILSAHCINDILARQSNMIGLFNANLNVSQGGMVTDFTCTNTNLTYLYEAYYFVPMLTALDQQRRGQFETALDWYRTVYDYTQNITTNRKIFYGLVLEESLTNIFSRPADWLLDPLNPHLIAQTRANAYTRYTLMNIVQCLTGYADREFTTDTSETVPRARILYTAALDLLQSNELNLAPNSCITEAHCMPDTIVSTFVGTRWENLFNDMQSELATINDATVLDATRDDIIEVFEDDMLSAAEQFAAVFELIATAKAGMITTPLTVTEVVDGAAERFTVAMQFLEAPMYLGDATSTFMQTVGDNYDLSMSRISGITVAELNANVYNSSVLQLSDANPLYSLPYVFRFMDDTGRQQRTGDGAYDPLNPNGTARQLNLEYSNTNSFIVHATSGAQREYAPLLDYYFCNPSNPVYDSLKLKINVELYKIFNCRNIAGMQRELDIYGAPTDSTTGIPIIGAQGNLVLPTLNAFKPSQYRFAVLISRAQQLVQQTSQIEAQFLSALEKRDAEYYNLMKARQDLQISKATIKLQDLRVKQANDEKVVSQIQYDRANYSYLNFSTWLNRGLSGFEVASLALLEATSALQFANTINFALQLDFANGVSSMAQAIGTQANIASQMASYERRQQEWQYQQQLADFDVDLAQQQIKISDDNIRIVSQEREIAQMNADFANDTLEFLKNKFTNAELYNWMSNVLEGVYAYMLNLSTAVARTAEGQLYFERQEPAGPFIQDDYWESPNDNYIASATGAGNADRRGLTGSARLLQDITRLDQYAFDTNKRKLQMSKTISLAQNFPEAFQRFRETGVLQFELTNDIFDHDFPGHYLRLINNVKTSVIGLVPVYGGIKASLTAGSISYVVISGNNGSTFQRIPINRMQNDSVALTSPTNATGLFEMQQLNGEMLNPFEGMGIESNWEFKLPRFSNRMDYDQIGDVVITVEYTALDSFVYREQVLAQINNELSFNRAFSFKNNFPDQWYELSNVLEGVDEFEVELTTKRSDFPAGLDIDRTSRIVLYFVRKDNTVGEINIADFNISSGTSTFAGTTVNGIFNAQTLLINNDPLLPFQTWRLKFDNAGDINRLLFLNEDITDILFVITCDATLPAYV